VALKKFIQLLNLAREVNDEENLASATSGIGLTYFTMKEFQKAIEFHDISASYYKKIGNDYSLASNLMMVGASYSALKEYPKALENLEKALKIFRELENVESIAGVLNYIAKVYGEMHEYDQSIMIQNQALALHRKLGAQEKIAKTLTDVGLSYKLLGHLEKAMDAYEKALAIFKKQKNVSHSIHLLSLIASVYGAWGQFDKQIEITNKAIDYRKQNGEEVMLILDYLSLGNIYKNWAKFDIAHKYYEQALVLSKKYNSAKDLVLAHLGFNYLELGEFKKGEEYLYESLKIAQELGDKQSIANSLKGIAFVHRLKKEYEKAIKTFKQALKIYTEIGSKPAMARSLFEIGDTYIHMLKIDKAWEYLKQAMEISQDGRNIEFLLDMTEAVAILYMTEEKYIEANKYFNQAIKFIENIRETASGSIRRDFLETRIYLYRLLAGSYLMVGKGWESLSALEQSRSRLLMDKLLNDNKKFQATKPNIIKKQINANSAILAYGRLFPGKKTSEPLFEYAITIDNYIDQIVNTNTLFSQNEKFKTAISNAIKNQRGVKVTAALKSGRLASEKSENYLDNLVRYYRSLLANPSSENDIAIKEVGRALYDLLIKPLFPVIQGKKNLLIIPDGILSFVPFETLIDENGNYLIEKFNIGYVQSLAVANLLRERKYEEAQKPMLAFGGAVYNLKFHDQRIIETDVQLSALTSSTLASLIHNNTRSASEALARLGYGSWTNLPGTRVEVDAISKIIENSDVYFGEEVNEAKIKEMSAKGELSKYKVLHFATHGLTVPEFPELSSIVLSQVDNKEKKEDGYLRMEEIAKLKIKAEFVNLSACQTGLGKLYAGEGLVGLTHAFLLAGANGLSVSLWNVADESTVKFMSGLYQLVEQEGMTYFQAINAMKRSFIRGKISTDTFNPGRGTQFIEDTKAKPNKLSHPFYWAPFVYYGVN